MRRRPLRPLPARPDARLPGRPGLPLRRELAPLLGGAGSCDAPGRAQARGVEVRLVRRLPAQPARLRGRAAGARRARSRSPTSSRRRSAIGRGPYDLSLVEGSITTRARRRAHPRGPARVATPGHHRRLRHRRRHPGAAQLRRRRRVRRASSTRRPSTSRRSRPRRRSPPTCRSTSSCAAARSTSASCSR